MSNGDGRIVDNIVYFARVLRKAGMKVGPAAVRDAVEAVQIAGVGSREEFYWVLHSVFVKRREDHRFSIRRSSCSGGPVTWSRR
jgi:uncharacterized protein with von Willebrand factor type A (vWA) domain